MKVVLLAGITALIMISTLSAQTDTSQRRNRNRQSDTTQRSGRNNNRMDTMQRSGRNNRMDTAGRSGRNNRMDTTGRPGRNNRMDSMSGNRNNGMDSMQRSGRTHGTDSMRAGTSGTMDSTRNGNSGNRRDSAGLSTTGAGTSRAAGATGATGVTGTTGTSASGSTSGVTGTTGTTGGVGTTGSVNGNATTGSVNGTGTMGTTGSGSVNGNATTGSVNGTGTMGTTGSVGTNGTSGSIGTNGTTGRTGTTGSVGTSGTTGTNTGTSAMLQPGDKIGKMTVSAFNSLNAKGNQMVSAIKPAKGTLSQGDQQLLMEIAAGGQRQLAMSQAVVDKLTNPQAKLLARSEVEEQTGVAAKLQEIATAMGVTLPGADSTQTMMAQIQNMTGSQLDALYIEEGGIKGHELLQTTMTKVNSTAKNTALKQLATATLPVIRTHLTVSRDVKTMMGSTSGSTGAGSTQQ